MKVKNIIKLQNIKNNHIEYRNNMVIASIMTFFCNCISCVLLQKVLRKASLVNNLQKNKQDTYDERKDITQTLQKENTKSSTNEFTCTMINRIEDIKNKRNERMDDAAFFSDKISGYIRYLAITGLGLIWLLIEKNEYKLDTLLHNPYAQIMIISCLLTLILELVHLIMNVIVNLLYANSRLRKPLSYVAKPRKTQYVATKFPKVIVKIEWTIWFVKIICLIIALLVFVCCLLYKMFG